MIEGPEIDILEKIKIARSKDEKVVRVVKHFFLLYHHLV